MSSMLVPLVLSALCLACVQAQGPRFTFAASNYHPPADEATILQSPSYQQGVNYCSLFTIPS